MEMVENVVRINKLYDTYKELLTDKQKNYFEAFYYDNYSLSEIAENFNVSRAAVHSQIKIVKDYLEELESKLNLSKINDMLEEIKNLNNKSVNEVIKSYEEK